MSDSIYEYSNFKVDLPNVDDGWYLVKDGITYRVEVPIGMKPTKTVNIKTGEVAYPTNYDMITHMSVEELARFINFHTVCLECPAAKSCKDSFTTDPTVCVSNLLNWLRQEAKT